MRLAALSLAGLLAACSKPVPNSPHGEGVGQAAEVTTTSRLALDSSEVQSAIAALRAEPAIVDLVYDPQLVVPWTIGMANDGTPRTGYAEYICMLLKDHGAAEASTTVRIVDYPAYMQNGGDARGASMAHVDCSTGRDLGV